MAYGAFKAFGLPVVGLPKTIDNDILGTDTSVGFTTACEIVIEEIDRIHSTAASHRIIYVIEVMGRNAGWIALRGGLAAGADAVLISEWPLSVDEVCEIIERRRRRGKRFSIIVVSEGYPLDGKPKETIKDAFGHERLANRRVGDRLAALLQQKSGLRTEAITLKQLQRGGIPATYDRWIAIRLAIRAVDLVHNKRFGLMAAVSRNEIVDMELREAASGNSLVPQKLFEELRWLFG